MHTKWLNLLWRAKAHSKRRTNDAQREQDYNGQSVFMQISSRISADEIGDLCCCFFFRRTFLRKHEKNIIIFLGIIK